MALTEWMHLVLRVVHDLSHFLLFGTLHDPAPVSTTPTISPRSSLDNLSPTPSPSISERAIGLVAGAFGIVLPQAVTLVHGLPAATAVLLRLTEVLPADVVLFLCLSGLLLWVFVFGTIGCLSCWCIYRGCRTVWRRFATPPPRSVTFAPDSVESPESEEDFPNRGETPAICAARANHTTSRVTDVPVNVALPFSDAALSSSNTVAAHGTSLPLVPLPKRRTRRSST